MIRYRMAHLSIAAAYMVARWAYMTRTDQDRAHEFVDVNALRAIRDRYKRNV